MPSRQTGGLLRVAGRGERKMVQVMRNLKRLPAAFDSNSGQFVRIPRALPRRVCEGCRIFCARWFGGLRNSP